MKGLKARHRLALHQIMQDGFSYCNNHQYNDDGSVTLFMQDARNGREYQLTLN